MRWFVVLVGVLVACGPVVDAADGEDVTGEPGSSSGAVDGSSETTAPAPDTGGPVPGTTGPMPGTDSGNDDGSNREGLYYVALSPIIAETTPFQFVGTIEADDDTVTMTLTPLSLDVASIDSPRDLLPPPIELTGIIDREGFFSVQVDALSLSGAANPVTGSDLVTSLRIEGPFADDVICARVSGMVTSPANIDLTGSTFSAMRTDLGPNPSPEELPLPDDIDCG